MSDKQQIIPARKATVRAIPWSYLGFAAGFLSNGQTLIADFMLRVGGGISGAIVVYVIAMAYYGAAKPADYGNGGTRGAFQRIGIFCLIGVAIAIIAAFVLPALFGKGDR